MRAGAVRPAEPRSTPRGRATYARIVGAAADLVYKQGLHNTAEGDVRKAAVRILHFRVVHFADMKCIAGGPGQISLTSKEQTRTVFVAAGEIAFFRADDEGHITCRAARWRDTSELLANFE